jgi:hypothetical protein
MPKKIPKFGMLKKIKLNELFVLIENLERIKTFCVRVQIIFLNKVFKFFWETK